MTDVTYAIIDEMEPIHEGLARRARAELGVTACGMQVMPLPPVWDSHEAFDAFGETLIPILGAAGIDPGEPMIYHALRRCLCMS
jgi:hypothetical protein